MQYLARRYRGSKVNRHNNKSDAKPYTFLVKVHCISRTLFIVLVWYIQVKYDANTLLFISIRRWNISILKFLTDAKLLMCDLATDVQKRNNNQSVWYSINPLFLIKDWIFKSIVFQCHDYSTSIQGRLFNLLELVQVPYIVFTTNY